MPTYGYRCRSCGNEFEVLQKISDPPLKTCPKCAGQLDKMVYAAGIIYKGSGYYNTDYKSGSKGSEKAAEKADSNGSGSSSESSSEGSGDAKPAAEPKTESKAPKSDSTD
ncbi:MAG TPA: FmdB family zinc ribbon protein [Candidatus Dormibacteraeota bacterium]|nr:FmdB family zinc ribbon protein [Candidatus Dormibacteraeota bacterium]